MAISEIEFEVFKNEIIKVVSNPYYKWDENDDFNLYFETIKNQAGLTEFECIELFLKGFLKNWTADEFNMNVSQLIGNYRQQACNRHGG